MKRRNFIQQATALTVGALGLSAFKGKSKNPLLAFSTLGCPDWSLPQIVEFASKHGFKGIEVRGLLRQMDLSLCKEFDAQNLSATMRLMKDNDLKFVNLGSSCTLHFADAAQRQKNLDEGKRFIDLAQKLECPFIRVFPNNFPKEQTKEQTLELIASGLKELGDYSANSKVKVLMETHGDVLYIADLAQLMKMVNHSRVGLVWDMTNMWVKTKESPTNAYKVLRNYIHHTHIKNADVVDGKITYTRLAQGQVPIFETIDVLRDGGYQGYYSFEWEKLWHPELEEPELAFADYAAEMKKHFQ